MSALELVLHRVERYRKERGVLPTAIGAPLGVFNRLCQELNRRPDKGSVHMSAGTGRSYAEVALWDENDGLGVRTVEVFSDRNLSTETYP